MQSYTWLHPLQPILPRRLHPSRSTCNALDYRQLGNSDLHVSSLCFGTMLFGESTDRQTAYHLLNTATEAGINFFDSAEMYPVPQSPNTHGRSEVILGNWFKQLKQQESRKSRSDFVIATKISGPGSMDWIRSGPSCVDAKNISEAIDGSLKRLQTDYIDLIQIHWPDRYVPMFGSIEYDPLLAYSSIPIEEQLEALHKAVHSGKVRYIGLSNETPWGLMKFCTATSTPSTSNDNPNPIPCIPPPPPRPISLQNAYNLTCRTFDSSGLAECCLQENVSLLAYSPLAMGLLTGKYIDMKNSPPEARLNKYKGRYAEAESRYGPKVNVHVAIAEYAAVAKRYGMSLTELALRFVLEHPLVASAVIGATGVEQLGESVEIAERVKMQGKLEDNIRAAVDAIHARYPNPTP
ncbi:putative Protein tas [Nannochloris sp. 'desiccata']|nr:putative Protein tas [Chlorella desiccata (nom. nud.)]KAH7615756.1 putative Protein tas [Chlorella desiccata (nom. nud.)]